MLHCACWLLRKSRTGVGPGVELVPRQAAVAEERTRLADEAVGQLALLGGGLRTHQIVTRHGFDAQPLLVAEQAVLNRTLILDTKPFDSGVPLSAGIAFGQV